MSAETEAVQEEPRCICGDLWSYHEHGASLTPDFSCRLCDCPDFVEDFTAPMFDLPKG